MSLVLFNLNGSECVVRAIARFKRTGGPKIILISFVYSLLFLVWIMTSVIRIKSGSVGLNLTCANRVRPTTMTDDGSSDSTRFLDYKVGL